MIDGNAPGLQVLLDNVVLMSANKDFPRMLRKQKQWLYQRKCAYPPDHSGPIRHGLPGATWFFKSLTGFLAKFPLTPKSPDLAIVTLKRPGFALGSIKGEF